MADDTSGETLFDLPTSPDSFGLVLPSAKLRRIDFSGLDYDTALRSQVEYIKTYYPDRFNDFTASNGFMMMVELIAAAVGKLSLRGDILANEGFITTATTEAAVANHLALINQKIRRQTPAAVEIQCTLENPVYSDVRIPAGTSFQVRGPGQSAIRYELYRSPGDYRSDVVIPAGKRGVVGLGLEGQLSAVVSFTSNGSAGQVYTITEPTMLDSPLYCTVASGTGASATVQEWAVVQDPIERYGPLDRVVEVNFLGDTVAFRFGDNQSGACPLAGQTVGFQYRTGGGAAGRIGAGQIGDSRQLTAEPPASSPVLVGFTNAAPSLGGSDKESLEAAKRRAPRDYALRAGIVTPSDYAQAASSFSHPAFGAVAKAVATVRTARNANLVEVYCLAVGEAGSPVAPNAGLKQGLKTYYTQRNVLSDSIAILDGRLLPVDVTMTVVMSRSVDGSVVKAKVERAVTDFFAADRWEMGQALYVSSLVEAVKGVDGVSYVDLFAPADNLLRGVGVQFNELIVEGNRAISYYYEKATA